MSASYTIDAAQADTLTQESIDEILARDDVSVELIDNPPSTIREWLKAQLMYLSGTGFISDVEPKDIEDQSGYEDFAGIRAPADQIAHDDQLNSPTPEYGNAAVHVKTGSPMSFSAIVDVLAGEAMLAFDFTFLHPDTTLSVTLGGNNILTLLANDYPIGTRQSINMAIAWDTITSELIFTLDSPTANLGALIYNLRYPGADLRSIGNWFANGGGTAQYVYATSDVQMDALRIAASDPDGDGLATYYDNCPNVQNTANFPDSEGWAQQQDDDGDNIGNACDLVVTTPWLPSGRAGKIYNRQLTATRGIPPYTWTITSGNPPLGVTLNSAGLLYGNVQSTFLTFFTVKVTDATGDSAFKDLSIRIIIPACVSCHATPEL